MARHVHLEFERLERGSASAPLVAAVLLRVRGVIVLDWRVTQLNDSAIALARAAGEDHVATPDAEWPLFFGSAPAGDRAGAADCSVRHQRNRVTLSDFRACAVAADASFEVPWSAFAAAVLRVGDYVVRRTAAGEWRDDLRARLKPVRARRRMLARAERP